MSAFVKLSHDIGDLKCEKDTSHIKNVLRKVIIEMFSTQ